MRFHKGLHNMRFCVKINGLLKNLGRTKTLPSRSLFCDIAKMTDNLNSQKGKDFYQNIFISQCGTLPILLWQKNIYRVSAVCRCAVLQRLQMSAIGERDITQLFSAIIYTMYALYMHASGCFAKILHGFTTSEKKTK